MSVTARHKRLLHLVSVVLAGLCFSGFSGGQQLATLSEVPVAVGGGEIGDLLRKWYSDGTAAGNSGDYYDNRDGGHSLLNLAPYPQVQKIEYTDEEKKTRRDWGMQQKVRPYVVFGNSSTSAPPERGGSIARGYYTIPRGLEFLFAQYIRNNIYVYPEHLDHDPGHNGWGGYGDLFPTNSPYLIISQGSSGSDQPFMRALPYVLAAFRPEVKKRLVQEGLLMPVLQMILRFTGRQLEGSGDYLTGTAHPTVFQGRNLDVRAMAEMAHGITLSSIPPIALIRAISEEATVPGADYFDPERTEKLADTPTLIARIFRGSSCRKTIVVSAEESRDINGRPLKFHWAVLRGDPEGIKIAYRNSSRSVAEITVPYFERSPVAKDSALESNRVDIGIFVHNGVYYSPPSFVTFYTLDNEARTYAADGRLLEIGYDAGAARASVSEWNGLFDIIASQPHTWPAQLLRSQFTEAEIGSLVKASEEFRRVHAELVAAHQKLDEALKSGDKSAVAAARKAVSSARQLETQALEKKREHLETGTAGRVREALHALIRNPDFWNINAGPLENLAGSAGEGSREALSQAKGKLIDFGIAEEPDGATLRLTPLRKGKPPLASSLTRYEKGMIERFNAAVLSRVIFPGIVDAEWKENYVDARITSAREWRDVYRYAPDGTPLGWTRFQSGGAVEFNPEGMMVLDKDSQGRCARARAVRYELEPQKRDPAGRPRVKLVPTETIREYEYAGPNDWKGRTK